MEEGGWGRQEGRQIQAGANAWFGGRNEAGIREYSGGCRAGCFVSGLAGWFNRITISVRSNVFKLPRKEAELSEATFFPTGTTISRPA